MDRNPPSPRAFTLLEIIIVMAVLAIIMAMTVPRLLGREGRLLQLTADRVSDLLAMFAQRETLSGRPTAIWHDTERHLLVLLILDIDEAAPEEPAQWRPDRTVRPVRLPPSLFVQRGIAASVDGSPVDMSQWPIATEPGRPRPSIEISLYADDGNVKTIALPSHALAPYQLDDAQAVVASRRPVDLDAAGRHREDW